MNRRAFALSCAAMALQLPFAASAQSAQPFPSRPITLVVPFAVGGGNDALARLMADKMSRTLGQPVVVDNRAGGAGIVGSAYVAKSAPDGYTLLLGFTGTMAVNPFLYANAGYDPLKDFAPVGRIGSLPMVLVVNSASNWKSLKDVIDSARQTPGKLTYGSGGAGTLLHIAAEMVASRAGIQLTHIPYKSTGPAVTDLLGGQIDMMFSSPVAVMGNISTGKLRPIAVTASSRIEAFPGVPTMAESGLAGFSAISSYGLLAPARTPQPVIDVLNKALNDALSTDDVKKRLAADVTQPRPGRPADYTADMRAEIDTWGGVVKKFGLKAE